MFTTSISRCIKENLILAKTFHLFSNTWTLFFKLPQVLGSIQVFASSLKTHDYNNLTFKSPCKQEFKNNVPKNNIMIPIKSSTY